MLILRMDLIYGPWVLVGKNRGRLKILIREVFIDGGGHTFLRQILNLRIKRASTHLMKLWWQWYHMMMLKMMVGLVKVSSACIFHLKIKGIIKVGFVLIIVASIHRDDLNGRILAFSLLSNSFIKGGHSLESWRNPPRFLLFLGRSVTFEIFKLKLNAIVHQMIVCTGNLKLRLVVWFAEVGLRGKFKMRRLWIAIKHTWQWVTALVFGVERGVIVVVNKWWLISIQNIIFSWVLINLITKFLLPRSSIFKISLAQEHRWTISFVIREYFKGAQLLLILNWVVQIFLHLVISRSFLKSAPNASTRLGFLLLLMA